MKTSMIAVAAVGVFAGTSLATTVGITNNPVADFTALEGAVGTPLTPIDVSGVVTGASLSGTNTLTSNFAAGPFFSGTLTSEVFADQSTIGPGVDTVVIKYTFAGNGPQSIDAFQFGFNAGSNLDFADITGATHGVINADTTPGQLAPAVVAENAANITLTFDFQTGGDALGAETLTWYVAATGAVAVEAVPVNITNSESTVGQALVFTDIEGQDDLNVPAPGAALLGVFGAAAAARRRR